MAFDPATITAAASIIGNIEEFLGIGGGRREADQIVPYQNQIHYNVLAPVSKALESDMSYNELQSAYKVLADTETAWLTFLRTTDWDDGRAAVQAEATLEPYFTGMKAEIQRRLSGISGGVIPGDTITDWFPSYPVDIPGVNPPVYTATGTTTTTSSLPSWLLPGAIIGAIVLMSRRPSRRY